MIISIQNAKIVTILVNYNGYEDTKACLMSLQEMTIDTSVIVVDNASNNEYCKQLIGIFPKLTLIESKKNLGFAGGNNLGIKYALKYDIDYIMLLNNDTIVDKGLLKELMIGITPNTLHVPRMMYYKEKNRVWYAGGNFNKITGRAIHTHINYDLQKGDKRNVNCTFATGCCLLIPIEIIRECGQLDERYFMYCEDSEFCLRILSKQKKIRYIGNAVLWHKVSNSTGGNDSLFSVYYMTRNRLLYLMTYKTYFHFITIPLFFLSRVLRIMQYWLKDDKERSLVIFLAIRDGIKREYGKRY